MRMKKLIARQLRKPSGIAGRWFVGKSLNKSNGPLEDMGLELMQLQPEHHVLEVGFGNGRLISRMAEVVKEGSITGIDISRVMVSQAKKKNRDAVRSGKVKLHWASVADIPAAEATFDRVFTANTVYFWPDPTTNIQEVLRVMNSGAIFLCGLRLKGDMLQMDVVAENRDIFQNLYTLDEITSLLESAGFVKVTPHVVQRKYFSDVIVVGTKP